MLFSCCSRILNLSNSILIFLYLKLYYAFFTSPLGVNNNEEQAFWKQDDLGISSAFSQIVSETGIPSLH